MTLAVTTSQVGGALLVVLFVAGALWLLLNSRPDKPFGAWFGRLLDDHDWRRIHRIWLLLIAAGALGLALGGASAGVVVGFVVVTMALTGIVGDLTIAANFRRRHRDEDDQR